MTEAATIAKLLGGTRTLKHRVAGDEDLLRIVRAGIPARVISELASNSASAILPLLSAIGMSPRTYDRRAAANESLKPIEANSVLRVARAVAFAKKALGDEGGIEWLHEKNRALNLRRPIDLLDTEIGTRLVEQVLGRIEHGVFS
ncbi:MAG: DUF2384 domain-containing protein [Candidatus Eremiobacteraeota bacterium]|nr:DUF2384 domain-containing protein [Candidatus Eremiobacteraeota bacterium]